MNNTKKLGIAGLVTVALAALAVVAPTAAYADSSVAPTVGSGAGQTDEAVYLLDENGVPFAGGTVLQWGDQPFAGPSATDPLAVFTAPPAADADSWYTFISPRGQERDYTAWNGYSYWGGSADVALAAVSPANLVVTGTGSPAGAAAVAAQGGDWSIGLAFVKGTEVTKVAFSYVTITAGTPSTATYTFSQPVADTSVAPAITTQPANATVNPGATATFTAAASGSPAPTVQWQSKVGAGSFADVAGATGATLTVSNATLAQSGTQYRAVFTNSKGSATTDAATLTVAQVAPTEPTGSAPGKVTIADPAKGATTVTVPAGAGHESQTLQAWGWSDPTNLGQVTTDAAGTAVVDITGLPAGAHTIGLTVPGDATFTVVAWGTIVIPTVVGDPLTDTVDVQATVTASDLWALEAENTKVDFGSVARNASATAKLGKVTVIDDRNVLKGWSLDAAWSDFTKGSDVIPASALTLKPQAYAGYTPLAGVTIPTAVGSKIAESTAVSTVPTGALLDADLTFTAPVTAQAGEYHSTLTLTLTSK
ncbi:immunoglobulin domain-containing protein [Agromyces sp. MMS24-K17]|uniref:immunoglobulin domain-containing protein n=1 Tax=Agromyces sp. MMS24-K17 TaxID=3372850 RepID=UPI0037540614